MLGGHGPARDRRPAVHRRSADRRPPPVHRRAGELAEVQPGLAFVDAFANSAVVDTDDGLVVVDTSGVFHAKPVHDDGAALVDRAGSTPRSSRTATSTTCSASSCTRRRRATNGWAPPRVIAHELRARALRPLQADRGLQRGDQPAAVQRARTRAGRSTTATPTRRTATRSTLDVGGERFELHHARGETDDATWVWAPARTRRCSRATCSSGRRPTAATRRRCSATRRDWAVAFRTMAALDAEVLLPGHGLPIVGADRVHQALAETARSCSSRCSTRRSR